MNKPSEKKTNNANTNKVKEYKKMEVANVKTNNAIVGNDGIKALDNALANLGYKALHTDNYTYEVEKDIDGNKVLVPVTAKEEDEKRAIDEMYIYRNITDYAIPRQCALLAFIESKGTHKEKGVTFKAYAKSVVCGKLSEQTIQKYTNIGKCFFKALSSIQDELAWVDDRLANMNGKQGVSVSNLDIVLATFNSYVKKTALEDVVEDYRDYVGKFLDEYCIDTPEKPARLHLEATGETLKEEVRKVNGKEPNKPKKTKNDNKPTGDNEKTLNPFDGLVNALTRYKESDKPNETLLARVNDLIDFIEKMPETPEK